jgi:hypothetical protein
MASRKASCLKPLQRVPEVLRSEHLFLPRRDELALQAVLPDGEGILAHAPVAVTRTAVLHVAAFPVPAHNDEPGAAEAADGRVKGRVIGNHRGGGKGDHFQHCQQERNGRVGTEWSEGPKKPSAGAGSHSEGAILINSGIRVRRLVYSR